MKTSNVTNVRSKSSTQYMVQLAAMIAVILIMSFTPLGYLRTPILSITLLTIPVAVGAVLLGPTGGAICGAAFGLTSFYNALSGGSAMGTAMITINMFYAIIVMVVARVLEGWISGLIFSALHRSKKTRKISYYAASLACPLLNTFFFMGFLVLLYYKSDYVQGLVSALGATNPISFIILAVGTQGLIEAVICFLVASMVSRTLYKVLYRE